MFDYFLQNIEKTIEKVHNVVMRKERNAVTKTNTKSN